MDYKTSSKFALHLGYEEVKDPKGFCGKSFIKDGKKWIHDIDLLMDFFACSQYSDLQELCYDVETYDYCKNFSNKDAEFIMSSTLPMKRKKIFANFTKEFDYASSDDLDVTQNEDIEDRSEDQSVAQKEVTVDKDLATAFLNMLNSNQ